MMFVLLTFTKSGSFRVLGFEPNRANAAVTMFEDHKKLTSTKALFLITSEGPQLKWEAE